MVLKEYILLPTFFNKIIKLSILVFLTACSNHSSQDNKAPVNPHLWRASLESINFMPLVSADAFGGVIITDWYINPKTPNERIKVSVFITDQVLRADALKVVVYKQIKGKDGNWTNSHVDSRIATELENIILTKARQLRIRSIN